MFGLLVLRSVVYFTQAGMYHDDRLTGNPDGWNVAYYVFTFLRGVMFFVVIVLIGTGWSYLRPYIGENEKKILVVVIPLQVDPFLHPFRNFAFSDLRKYRDYYSGRDVACWIVVYDVNGSVSFSGHYLLLRNSVSDRLVDQTSSRRF